MVIPKSGPASPQTQSLMQQIRDLEPSFGAKTGVQFGVTGQTAMMSDLSEALPAPRIPQLVSMGNGTHRLLVAAGSSGGRHRL
ncbi:MAG: ydfJ [Mycobacterium sp.]|jgi:RND superfamily putative drug exporter|nr:ydfJ [Mycobacterium sp.]